MLAPWLVLNVDRYGSPTVNTVGSPGVAGPVQTRRSTACWTCRTGRRLLDGVLPQEWIVQLGVWWVRVDGLPRCSGWPRVAALVAGRREWRAWFLALPAIAGLGCRRRNALTGTDIFYLRYVYPALYVRARRRDRARAAAPGACSWRPSRSRRRAVGRLAGFFWFNDLGASSASEVAGRPRAAVEWRRGRAAAGPASDSAHEVVERLRARRAAAPFLLYRDAERRQRIVELGRRSRSSTSAAGRRARSPWWDGEVSRVHAVLERAGAHWTLADDGLSRNGSFVNGRRVRGRRRLDDRDEIGVGRTLIVFASGPGRR